MYTIQLNEPQPLHVGAAHVLEALQYMKSRVRYRFTFDMGSEVLQRRLGPLKMRWLVKISKVRLKEKRPYCGNHPGSCPVGARKMNSTFLEWDDWVEFNNGINDILDRRKINADVWSMPHDVKGKFWIRKDNQRRTKYDYTETFNTFGRPLRVWNAGTPNQFT